MDHGDGGAETGDRPPLALHALPNSIGWLGVGVGWDGPKATARWQHFNALNAKGGTFANWDRLARSLSACSEELANLICSLVARIALATT